MKHSKFPCQWLHSGTWHDVVYYYDRKTQTQRQRKYVKPRISESNRRMGAIMKQLMLINPSKAYRQDCETYALRYRYEHSNDQYGPMFACWTNVFCSLMYKLAKKYPDIDLAVITRQDIEKQDLPCRTLAKAIEAGLLPAVRNHQYLQSVL